MSERHSMRKIREVLRLKFECGLKERPIATAVGEHHHEDGGPRRLF